jgi:hypothetical protein
MFTDKIGPLGLQVARRGRHSGQVPVLAPPNRERLFPMTRRPLILSLVLASAALPACGSLDTKTSTAPTLATIQGELVNPSAVPIDGNVRVAVVWRNFSGTGFNVAEDVPVQASFPASFTIDLSAPPPAAAMAEDDLPSDRTGALAANGIVVAYVDKNGNGQLDLVGDDASAYEDQILATSGNEGIFYLQGTQPPYPPAAGIIGVPVQGYNVFSVCPSPPPPTPGSICRRAACSDKVLPVTTPITLTASTDPQANRLMCASDTGSSEGGGLVPAPTPGRPTTYPSPCDVNLVCADDGSSYTYGTCTVEHGICNRTYTDCSNVVYDRPTPTPADWPCKP